MISCRDHSPTLIDLVHLDDAIGESAHHIPGMVQMTGLLLVEFGQRSKRIGRRGGIDDCAKWLNGC